MNETSTSPVLLVVMDGWGMAPAGPYNALSLAATPVFDDLWSSRPHTTLLAHGKAVGLPDNGQMGNSEVGHLNLGSGRVVKQELTRINDALEDGSFANNPVFQDAIEKIRASDGRAHVMGLCSPGGVHSSLVHLYALIDLLSGAGLRVILHALTDGRDTPPFSARDYLAEIEKNISGKAEIGVVVGRYWSMDRDKRWDRVRRGYEAHVMGMGSRHNTSDEAMAAAYEAGQADEFIEPRIIVGDDGEPRGNIVDGDGVFFFNFRADRAREITMALTDVDFAEFPRGKTPRLASYVCMTEYRSDFGLPAAFLPHPLSNILGRVIADRSLHQFRCAETEKYAHVTFFFNGGTEEPFPLEERRLIPSPREVATYDLAPGMSASKVADAVIARMEEHDDGFILVNFANPDMVGHTGVLAAAVEAAATVDIQLGRLRDAIMARGGAMLVTADHGNSEQMLDERTGEPHTAHTLNPVPLILVDDRYKEITLRSGGSLRDVAPTLLHLMNLPVPPEMTGHSLISC